MTDATPSLDLSEHRDGVIFGFAFAGGAATPLRDWAAIERARAGGGFLWVHLDLAARQSRDWIAGSGAIPQEARDDLLESDLRSRFERYDDSVFAVLADLRYDVEDAPDVTNLRLWADRSLFLTARRHASLAVDRLHRAVRAGFTPQDPGELLGRLIHETAETLELGILHLGVELDDIEDHLLAGRGGEARDTLTQVRRFCVRFHRHLALRRRAVYRVIARPPAWIGEAAAGELREGVEMLGGVEDDLVATQERAKVLYEDMSARQGDVANRNLLILSVLTAVFSPMTLVTGIFGMNVGGLPGLDDPAAFWLTLIGMGLTGLLSFLGLRRLRIF